MNGFIYAICDDRQRVKIGWSFDPMRRFAKIKSDCSGQIRLLGIVDAGREREKEVHVLFSKFRINGEWFDLTAPAVSEFVRNLTPISDHPYFAASGAQYGKNRDHPLARYRATKRLSLQKLATRLGTTHATLSRYERGKQRPSAAALIKISAITGIAADEILKFCPNEAAA